MRCGKTSHALHSLEDWVSTAKAPPHAGPFLLDSPLHAQAVALTDHGGSPFMLQIFCPACENVVWVEEAGDKVVCCPECGSVLHALNRRKARRVVSARGCAGSRFRSRLTRLRSVGQLPTATRWQPVLPAKTTIWDSCRFSGPIRADAFF